MPDLRTGNVVRPALHERRQLLDPGGPLEPQPAREDAPRVEALAGLAIRVINTREIASTLPATTCVSERGPPAAFTSAQERPETRPGA